MHVTTPEASRLFREGSLVYAAMSHRGIRVDRSYLEHMMDMAEQKITEYEEDVRKHEDYKFWQRRYGSKVNLAGYDQLSKVVFMDMAKVYGYKPRIRTSGGERGADRDSASEQAMEGIDHPMIRACFRAHKYRRLRGTYLESIRREMVEESPGVWVVHPNISLNTVKTFRSSCGDPNMHSAYKRDPEFMDIFRRTFIPRKGKQFNEIDFVSAEVKICANYTKDPVAIEECNDSKKDPHRDAACKLFFLAPGEVTKTVRNMAKGPFVFAQFYGDYYVNCTRNIWHLLNSIDHDKDGKPLGLLAKVKDSTETILDRLKANGITSMGECNPKTPPVPGTFEHHVKGVENWYWYDKYEVHTQWKRDWWEAYQRTGGYTMLTGFASNAVQPKNEIINAPVQGSSFHVLVWSDIEKAKAIRKYKMDACLLMEIHDCDIAEVNPRERENYIEMSRKIMTQDVVRVWPWLELAPPQIEVEACPIDGPWAHKMQLLPDESGRWYPIKLVEWEQVWGTWK